MRNPGVAAVVILVLTCAMSVYAAIDGKAIEQQSLGEFIDQPLPKGVSYYVTDKEVIMVSAEDGRTLYLVNYLEGRDNYEDYLNFDSGRFLDGRLFYRPLRPEPDEVAVGNWGIVDYWKGGKQWTYNGKLVMVYRRDVLPGEISALERGRQFPVTPMMREFPKPEVVLPPGFSWRRMNNQWVIVDVAGKALYKSAQASSLKELQCDVHCQRDWKAVSAPSLLPKNTHYHDWSVVRGADGMPQWAYAGSPVYRSASDKGPESISKSSDGWTLITAPDVEFVIGKDKLLPEKLANR